MSRWVTIATSFDTATHTLPVGDGMWRLEVLEYLHDNKCTAYLVHLGARYLGTSYASLADAKIGVATLAVDYFQQLRDASMTLLQEVARNHPSGNGDRV